MTDMPYKFRRSRKAQSDTKGKSAWWYMSPGQIQVYIEGTDGVVRSCVIRKQALKELFK